jgi:hypothetical protein
VKILPLQDNAIFLQNWRERMRLSSVISGIVLTVSFVLLIGLHLYIQQVLDPWENPLHHGALPTDLGVRIQNFLKHWFWELAILEGILILVLGAFKVERATRYEKSSGNLEFHRSSPTDRFNQYLGLLLGPTCLDWCLTLGLMIISLVLAFLAQISFLAVMRFYLSLGLNILLCHTFAIFYALISSSSNPTKQKSFNLMFLLIIVFGLSGLVGGLFMLPSFYHITCVPSYQFLWKVLELGQFWGYDSHQLSFLSTFWGIKMPSLLLQGLVQIPLLIMGVLGIMRKVALPEHPVFSKTLSMVFTTFVLFLFVGSASPFFNPGEMYQNEYYKVIFVVLIFGLGCMGALGATPTRLLYIKGAVRRRKLGIDSFSHSEDHSSNMIWLLSFSLVCSVAYGVMADSLWPLEAKVLSCINLLSYVAFFAAALEYFQVGPHHRKKAIFWTGLAVFWVLIPSFGGIVHEQLKNPFLFHMLIASSPITGAWLAITTLTDSSTMLSDEIGTLWTVTGVNLGLLMMAIAFAAKSRRSALPLSSVNG